MSSLYELNARILTFEMEFDSDGVWCNEDVLDALQMERDEKIEQICLWIKNLRAEAQMVTAEAKNLTDRAKKLTNKADNLERYVALNLGGDKFETSKVKVGWRKSESVEIINADAVPERFVKNEVVKTPIKDSIKKYLKGLEDEGKTVPWARLVNKLNMQIK